MSLILEALRKLERDKDTPERGFLVTTHVPWAQTHRNSRLVGLAVLALALAVAALAAALWRGRGTPAGGRAVASPSPSSPSQSSPTASATPSGSPAIVARPSFVAPPLPLPSPPTTSGNHRSDRTLRPGVSAPPAASTPPPAPRAAAGPELRLNAISRQDDRPVAILNDRLVREGDVFDGIRVIRIGETEVEVEVRGQRRVLRF